jgi:hypothetical protein
MTLEQNPELVRSLDSDQRTPIQNAISCTPPSLASVQACRDSLDALMMTEDDNGGPQTRVKVLENRDETGNTALISAATTGNLELVSALIGAGGDVTAANNRGVTALYVTLLRRARCAGQRRSNLTCHSPSAGTTQPRKATSAYVPRPDMTGDYTDIGPDE